MKTIFQVSHGGTHLEVERDEEGNITISMSLSGEWHEPTITLVPAEVIELNRVVGE